MLSNDVEHMTLIGIVSSNTEFIYMQNVHNIIQNYDGHLVMGDVTLLLILLYHFICKIIADVCICTYERMYVCM